MLTGDPLGGDARVRLAAAIRCAVEREDIPLVRILFSEAAGVVTLGSLLPRGDSDASVPG